jgi:hypothetical protein
MPNIQLSSTFGFHGYGGRVSKYFHSSTYNQFYYVYRSLPMALCAHRPVSFPRKDEHLSPVIWNIFLGGQSAKKEKEPLRHGSGTGVDLLMKAIQAK